jgi:hypothetical protein
MRFVALTKKYVIAESLGVRSMSVVMECTEGCAFGIMKLSFARTSKGPERAKTLASAFGTHFTREHLRNRKRRV